MSSRSRLGYCGPGWAETEVLREKVGTWMKQRNGTPVEGNSGLDRWVWRLVSTGSVVAWMGFIFYLSSSTPAQLPRQLEAFSWLGKLRDVVGHLVLYGVLGLLLLSSVWSWASGALFRFRWALIAVGIGVAYGLLDEVHQSFTPGRSVSRFDALVDTVGVLVGVSCVRYVAGPALFGRREGVRHS